MKITHYTNGETMVNNENARDITDNMLRKITILVAQSTHNPEIIHMTSWCLEVFVKTKIDIIKVLNFLITMYGKYYMSTATGNGYEYNI